MYSFQPEMLVFSMQLQNYFICTLLIANLITFVAINKIGLRSIVYHFRCHLLTQKKGIRVKLLLEQHIHCMKRRGAGGSQSNKKKQITWKGHSECVSKNVSVGDPTMWVALQTPPSGFSFLSLKETTTFIALKLLDHYNAGVTRADWMQWSIESPG